MTKIHYIPENFNNLGENYFIKFESGMTQEEEEYQEEE